jgi:hypothetical protein
MGSLEILRDSMRRESLQNNYRDYLGQVSLESHYRDSLGQGPLESHYRDSLRKLIITEELGQRPLEIS